jgi:hypothetical protein
MCRGKQFKKLLLLLLVTFSFSTGFGSKVNGQEVRSVETEGSVKFTGVWVDPNQPTPGPPDGGQPDHEAKPPTGGNRPNGNLPQTNMTTQRSWLCLGLLLVLFVISYKKHQTKQMKEGKY